MPRNRRRPALLFVLFVLFVAFPLQRFFSSPSFELMRAVDMLLLFAAGAMSGVLLSGLFAAGRDGGPRE